MCEKCVGLDVRGTENMGLLLSDHRAADDSTQPATTLTEYVL